MKKFLLTAAVAFGALTVAAVGAQAKFTFALVPKNYLGEALFSRAISSRKRSVSKSLYGRPRT